MNVKSETIQGYQLVWLQEGCQASSREIQLVAGQHGEANEEVTKTIFMSNVTSFVDQKELPHLSLERPVAVKSVEDLVERQLREGEQGPSWWTLLALALGIMAILVVVGVLAYTYYRWKSATGQPLPVTATPP